MTQINVPTEFDELIDADLEDLQALSREVLYSGQVGSFQRHPLGFVFATLFESGGRRVRLHVWPSCTQVDNAFSIHDHMFSFVSRTIIGAVFHTEYAVSASEFPAEHALYDVGYDGRNSILRKTATYVRLTEGRKRVVYPGNSYQLDHLTFHATKSVSDSGSITLAVMDRTSSASPHVVGPAIGAESIAFERAPLDTASIASAASLLFPKS